MIYWNKEIITRLVLCDIEKVHSGWIKLTSNSYLSFVWHSLYFPFTFLMMIKIKTTTTKNMLKHWIFKGTPNFKWKVCNNSSSWPYIEAKTGGKKEKMFCFQAWLNFLLHFTTTPHWAVLRGNKGDCLLPDFSHHHLLIPLGSHTWWLWRCLNWNKSYIGCLSSIRKLKHNHTTFW